MAKSKVLTIAVQNQPGALGARRSESPVRFPSRQRKLRSAIQAFGIIAIV
jgi:hypothetical protein